MNKISRRLMTATAMAAVLATGAFAAIGGAQAAEGVIEFGEEVVGSVGRGGIVGHGGHRFTAFPADLRFPDGGTGVSGGEEEPALERCGRMLEGGGLVA